MILELFVNGKKKKIDVEYDGKTLDISNKKITSLEGLPPTLTTLYIWNNQITSLEGIPPTLTTLNIGGNQITSLISPQGDLLLPPTLTTLYISYNQITSLKGLPPSLTELNISANQISSLLSPQGDLLLPSTLAALWISDNQITSLLSPCGDLLLPPTLTELDISGNQITLLLSPQGDLLLPPTLTALNISDNQISSLLSPQGDLLLPLTLTELDISGNQITSLEGLPPTLTTLRILRNQITSLLSPRGDLLLPPTLTTLDISRNQITSLPICLVHLRNLRECYYNNNPIEIGNLHPSVRRFLDDIDDLNTNNTIYNDGQNVHNIAVQESIRNSLNKITTYKQKITKSNFSEDEISFIDENEVHSFFHFTQREVLLFVENAIHTGNYSSETKEQLYSLLKEALEEGKRVCSTGRIGRMVNVLSGFDSNVEIKISDNSQIGAIISSFRNRNEPKEKVEEELTSRGFSKEEIDEWLEHY